MSGAGAAPAAPTAPQVQAAENAINAAPPPPPAGGGTVSQVQYDQLVIAYNNLKAAATTVATERIRLQGRKTHYKTLSQTLQAKNVALEANIATLQTENAVLKAAGGGATTDYWVVDTTKQSIIRPRHPIVKPFPTSPLPRQSLGRHPVQVGPPPRNTIKDGAIVRSEPPIEQDYRIPENHMVFFAIPKNENKLNFRGVPESAQQRRIAVVGKAFSNWWQRSYVELQNDAGDYDIRFAGVAYEGIDDPVAAKRHPPQKGRCTVSMNGIVSIYTRTDGLVKEGAKLGDTLEWVPIGCGQSWRQLGHKFEPCAIRVFKMSNFKTEKAGPALIQTEAPLMYTSDSCYATSADFPAVATKGPMDASYEVHDFNPGEPQMGDHGYFDMRVPADAEGRPRLDRIAFGAPPISPDFQKLLHTIGMNAKQIQTHPEVEAYLKLVKQAKAQKPFGHALDDKEGNSEAQQAFLVALSGLAASGALMGRKVTLSNGQGEWQYAPAQHWLEIYAEQLQNGINPEGIEYLYPNFEETMKRLKEDHSTEFTALESAGVIYYDGRKPRLNLLAAVDASGNVIPELDEPLKILNKYAGMGPAKKIWVAAFTAIIKAMQRGVIPGTSGNTIYTWDLVHAMAEKLDLLSAAGGTADITRRLQEITDKIETGGFDPGARDEIEALKKEAQDLHNELAPGELKEAVSTLLQQPLVGVTVAAANNVTPEEVKKGIARIKEAADGIHRLAEVVGVDVDPNDVQGTVDELIKTFDAHLLKYGNGGTSELWTDRTIDLFVLEASGRRLTTSQAHKLHAIINKMKDDNIDVGVVRAGIRKLVELSLDSNVAAWHQVSAPFYKAIARLDESVREEMSNAVKRYQAASDVALGPDLITEGYINLVAGGKALLDSGAIEYFPRVIDASSHLVSRNEEFTQRVFVGCLHFAEKAVMRLCNSAAPSDFGNAFKETDVGFTSSPGKLWDPAAIECRSMHMPRVRATDDAMYSVLDAPCRQMVTMMGNTMAYGALVRTLAMQGQKDQIDDMTKYFRFSHHAKAAKNDEVWITVLNIITVADFVSAMQPNATNFDEENPFKVLDTTDLTTLKVEDTNRIYIGKLDNFAHFAAFYQAVQTAGQTANIRLETEKGISVVDEINKKYKNFKESVKARFLADYGSNLRTVTAANRDALAAKLTESASLSGPQLYALFADYMPERTVFDGTKDDVKGIAKGDFVNMTAPCYFHDHPWGAAFYMADAASAAGAGSDYTSTVGDMWACKHPDKFPVSDKMYRAIYVVRPGLSLAPLATFMEAVARSNGDNEASSRGQLLDNGIAVMNKFFEGVSNSSIATFTPMRAETVSMQVAKKVLPAKEFAKRAKVIGKHSTAMKRHLLGSVRAVHSANMGRIAVATTAGRMVDGDAIPQEWAAWGMHFDAISKKLEISDKIVVKNPRERCFGTLIGIESGIVRVMLNPALANPIVA